MSKLKTAQKIGEKSVKIFDKIEDNDKKKGFNSLIDELEENSSIIWLKDKRNSMTEKQKEKLYKRNAITISEFIKHGSPIYQIYSTIRNGVKNTSKYGGKNALKYSFLEQVPCRFLVELGILQKPKSLTYEKLIEDTKKDAKNINIYLKICETICTYIPDAQFAIPFIEIAKHYSKRYKDHGTEIIIQRIKSQKKFEIKQQTNKELVETIR